MPTFHLEHADRLAALEHLEGRAIIERDRGEIDLDAAARDELDRGLQNRERAQAEKVEFHETRGLDPFHVELRDQHPRTRIAR